MRKILTIAAREYRAMVGTKAFVLSIVMMPILMLGGLIALQLLNQVGEIKVRKIAIADESDGTLYEAIVQAADARNKAIEQLYESASGEADGKKEGKELDGVPGFAKGEKYVIERIEGTIDDSVLIEQSERIKNRDLYGLLHIPAGVGNPEIEGASELNFYSQDSGIAPARSWLRSIIFEKVKAQRLLEADIDPQIVAKASTPIRVKAVGLVSESADGGATKAEEKDELASIFLPMGVMMLMFMVIFMAAQPMLESVLEEKSLRIAEVLLGSANPFQLMSGKLLGTVGGSVTILCIYVVGLYVAAENRGWTEMIPFHLVPWFIVFQILGVLFYAAIFMAVGASVSQLKEAQSMLLPVWMLLMAPMFIWFFIVQDPNGSIATWFSLFPPATPTTMMLRMSTGQTIPLWQPLLGIVLTTLSTLAIIVLAGRIFRVGILWQGKTPKLSEIIKWGMTG